jgi:hypothetical protein
MKGDTIVLWSRKLKRLFRRPRLTGKTLRLHVAARFLVALLLLGSLSVTAADRPGAADAASVSKSDDATISALVTAEETSLVLRRQLNILSAGLMDLRLPGPTPEAAAVFASPVSITDLAPAQSAGPSREASMDWQSWPVDGSVRAVTAVDLWRPLFDHVSFFEHARFAIRTGDHPGGNMFRYESEGQFDGLAFMKSGEWRSLRATLNLSWERAEKPEGKAGAWQIARWHTKTFEWNASPKRLFSESLNTAIRAPTDPASLRRSQHYEATVKYYREGMKNLPHPYFAPISVNQKEGIAIADVNGDGFDDIYIPVRLGKNMLLINHGDGTFSEQAATYHLDLPGHTTCALFADFDNDGDLDAMLGRSLLRTSYLENRDGVYVQHPIPKFMPMAVISMAAADYNGDGLLDVYLCTYRPAPPAGAGAGGGFAQVAKEGDFDWPDEFFSPEVARDFRRRLAEHKQKIGVTVLDQLGRRMSSWSIAEEADSSLRPRTPRWACGATPSKPPGAITIRTDARTFIFPTIGG